MAAVKGTRKFRLIAFDASRKNPFAGQGEQPANSRSSKARIRSALNNLVVVYSTEAGSGAIDGGSGNSPFAAAFAKHLTEPGVDVSLMLRALRDDVLRASGGEQQPFVYGSLDAASFYFVPPKP